MRQQPEAGKQGRFRITALAAATLIAIFAAGCDSRVDVKGPRFSIPTVPNVPGTPTGEMATETRAIAGVDSVALMAVGRVDITLGTAESLTITAPESVMSQLTSEVSGGRLELDRTTPSYQGQVSDIHYELDLRRLDELTLDGVGNIDVRGLDNSLFAVRVSGVGDVKASGRTDRQEVRVAGLSDYMAPALQSRFAEVHLSSGTAMIWATERIDGWVGYGATLEYWGNAEVNVQGGGIIKPLGLKP